MILKAKREFRARDFARKAPTELNEVIYEFTGERLNTENFEDDFYENYENFPNDLKEYFEFINDVSGEKGMPFLINTAKQLDIPYEELTPTELAIQIFRKDKKIFFEILLWYNINNMDTFRDFKGNKPSEPQNKNIETFKNKLIEFFKAQSRGNQINIDVYTKPNKIAYIIDYGDYLKKVNIFDEKETFKSVKQRQAKSITILYYPNLAKFQIKCSDHLTLNTVRDLFAEILIGDKDFFSNSDKIEFYDLNKLVSMREEDFSTSQVDDISEVNITNIEACLTEDEEGGIIVKHPKKLMQALEDKGLYLEQLKILRVNISFKFKTGRGNKRTIILKSPNISNLKDSPRDEVIKKYLKNWEILNV